MWVSEFSTVASWDTIDDSNNSFVLIEKVGTVGVPRIVTRPNGPYDLDSLAVALMTRLNTGKLAGIGNYAVTRVSTGASAATATLARAYLVQLSAGSFMIPPDFAVINGVATPGLDARSFGRICSFPISDYVSSLKSNFVDLCRCHQLFIHTPGFSSYNTLGPSGERNIIAKIPVDVGYGGAIHFYMAGSEHEAVECGVSSLNVINVLIKDVDGLDIDPKGGHWSMTLIFDH